MPPVLDGHLWTPPAQLQGFDCNEVLNAAHAEALCTTGYRFAIRYLRRIAASVNDLTFAEAQAILAAGLGLMAVQHVESATSWAPDNQKGYNYGQGAVENARRCGFPPGSMIWLDLEGVQVGFDHRQVIDYCNTWHAQVASAGFLPGVYVGWHCGLTAAELYRNLRFTHYWAAYNLNSDEVPSVRGVQMKQQPQVSMAGVTIDPDVILRDRLGSAPQILVSQSAFA